jgi:hypothetical protein
MELVMGIGMGLGIRCRTAGLSKYHKAFEIMTDQLPVAS